MPVTRAIDRPNKAVVREIWDCGVPRMQFLATTVNGLEEHPEELMQCGYGGLLYTKPDHNLQANEIDLAVRILRYQAQD